MTDKKKPEYLCDSEVEGASGGYKITMTDVMISSYQTGGSAGDTVPEDAKHSIDFGVVAREDIKRR